MKGWIAIVPGADAERGRYRPVDGYAFSDHIPHHRLIGVNDFFFLRDNQRLLTVARVQSITSTDTECGIERCPDCKSSQVVRVPKRASYRCVHGHEFRQPVPDLHRGKEYKARFGLDYVDLAVTIEVAEVRAFEFTNSKQLALRPGDVEGFFRYIARRDRKAAPVIRGWLMERVPILDEADAETGEADDLFGTMAHNYRCIRQRRGRKSLRDELIRRYGHRCMISGCTVRALLEASYIQTKFSPVFNNPTNGLLLRSDLHTLFDLNLIGINPARLILAIHPQLSETEYARFAGAPLLIDTARGPNTRALAARWQIFSESLKLAHSPSP